MVTNECNYGDKQGTRQNRNQTQEVNTETMGTKNTLQQGLLQYYVLI